ncbi:MAG: WHG domain-containing protein, partial [Solobacterium sp.]|nr:WHG domain-containing protein [Solobacterium sp.]
VDDLRRAAYRKADQMHTEYLMNAGEGEDPILAIGLNYIRFAVKEPNLFRFLFQSGNAEEKNLLEMINSEELVPVLTAMQGALEMDLEKTRQVFLTVALFAHGYASIIANNSLEFDEAVIAKHLEQAWNGAVRAAREDTK